MLLGLLRPGPSCLTATISGHLPMHLGRRQVCTSPTSVGLAKARSCGSSTSRRTYKRFRAIPLTAAIRLTSQLLKPKSTCAQVDLQRSPSVADLPVTPSVVAAATQPPTTPPTVMEFRNAATTAAAPQPHSTGGFHPYPNDALNAIGRWVVHPESTTPAASIGMPSLIARGGQWP